MFAPNISAHTSVVTKTKQKQFCVNSSYVNMLKCIICLSLLDNCAQISGPLYVLLHFWLCGSTLSTIRLTMQPFLSIHNPTSHYKQQHQDGCWLHKQMSHFYSLDREHLFKGLSILCKTTTYHCHSAGDGFAASTAHNAISIWSPGTAHGTLYAYTYTGCGVWCSHQEVSFCAQLMGGEGCIPSDTQTHRAKYVNPESSTRPSRSPLVLCSSPFMENVLENAMHSAPEAHICLSPGPHSSASVCCPCWLGFSSLPAQVSAMGLLTRSAVRLRAFVRLFGSVVTQDVLSRVIMHYSFFIQKQQTQTNS